MALKLKMQPFLLQRVNTTYSLAKRKGAVILRH